MGIIPTRVGTSNDVVILSEYAEDHPHACGDKPLISLPSRLVKGSSPRVWGQESIRISENVYQRIIPTRVGTSIGSASFRGRREDHPHACGDKIAYILHAWSVMGSSPRVWGQVIPFSSVIPHVRIIPTRVGTSNTGYSFGKHLQDHPHACGDKVLGIPSCVSASGSSPRVWGQVYLIMSDFVLLRIIPTRVGTSNDNRHNEDKA